MTYKKNDTYGGKFNNNGERHGKGIRNTDHLTYQGNFNKDKPTEWYAKFDDGLTKYEGGYKNSLKHGAGNLTKILKIKVQLETQEEPTVFRENKY